MNQFFKFFTASCLGVFAALVIIGLIFAGFFASFAGNKPVVPKNTVLELDFKTMIPELTGNVEVDPLSFEAPENLGLNTITALLEHASTDEKVKGILIKGERVNAGQATIATIREAIKGFKDSGKFVYSFADYYSQSGYYLASLSDSIYLNPNGMVDVKGFATLQPFFKTALDNMGIKMNVFYAGNFKSATEPFRRDNMSEESKLQTTQFLESMVSHYNEEVATSRGMTTEALDNIMSEYKGRDAESSLASGLVDRLAYWDEVKTVIRNNMELKEKKKIKFKSLAKYNNAVKLPSESDADDKVAVLYAEGLISYGTTKKGEVNETKYLETLEKIAKDEDIKALVLRVNSGGGSSLTSDILWRGIENIKAKGKPVVASFGDYAALTASEDNKKIADSLFSVNRDTLQKSFTNVCDSVYKIHYDRAVDSIKQLRIDGIKGLIDPGKE